MKKIFLFTALTLSVSACTGAEVRGNLGLDRRSPDAFNVVARPPLTVPKEFLLTPPDVGGDSTLMSKPDEKARAILTGSSTATPMPDATPQEGVLGVLNMQQADESVASKASAAEVQLLNKAGAEKANPEVKQVLRSEAWQQEKAKEDASLLDQFRDGLGGAKHDSALDPTQEAEALKKNNIPTTLPTK